MVLIFLWSLLTTPTDRLICSMWLSSPPTAADVRAACGVMGHVEFLTMQGVEIATGRVVCEQPASSLPVLTCDLWPLSLYRLDVIWPDFQQSICVIQVSHTSKPTEEEIYNQCPQAPERYELKYEGSREPDPPAEPLCTLPDLPGGSGLYDLPAVAGELLTTRQYAYLAGKLIWWGYVRPDCNGWSGLDPVSKYANECGLLSALPQVLEWQNRWDEKIYAAGKQASVPPRLIKAVIGQESQFWALARGTAGEHGMIQLTDDGADIVMRYSKTLYDVWCQAGATASRCLRGYAMLTRDEQMWIRQAFLISLQDGPNSIIASAYVLAAYYCYAGEIAPAPSWDAAVIAFHSGGSCLQSNCRSGVEYLDMVKR
jgi:hypothetical protein